MGKLREERGKQRGKARDGDEQRGKGRITMRPIVGYAT